eukprot:scaffold2033_cov164-Amphora_coffeaeformis.AAC.3
MKVLDTPQGLPQCHECKLPQIYIRDCNPEYYDYLLARVDTHCWQALHCSDRDRLASASRSSTSSYSIDRELEECKVWEPENGSLETRDAVPQNQNDTLYLFDGIPNKLPKHSVAICFTNPDIEWFIKMNKHGSLYRDIYMPNWTSKEIRSANSDLKLNLSDISLDHRWQYFGGTARYTFEADEETIKLQVINVETALGTLESLDDVLRCFAARADPKNYAP